MGRKKKTHFGRAGEFFAMSELLLRGWNVAVPVVDVGDDVFVIDDRDKTTWRLQVKTATLNTKEVVEGNKKASVREAKITLSRTQLKQQLEIELIYFFLVRADEAWTWFIVQREVLAEVHAKHLEKPHKTRGPAPKADKDATSDGLALTLRFGGKGEVRAWSSDFGLYRGKWPPALHVVDEGPGTTSTVS